MQYLDHVKLQAVMDGFTKKAFVPMPGGAQQPVAGAGPMTEGMAAPMDPAMAGGAPPMDPAMMGGDPAMGGMPPEGMPMDPAMGGMPPEGMPMDPAMMGAPPAGSVTMSVPELLQLIEVIKGGGGSAAPAAPGEDPASMGEEVKPKKTSGTAAINEKLDALLGVLGMGGGAPPMDPAAGGGMPPPPMPPM